MPRILIAMAAVILIGYAAPLGAQEDCDPCSTGGLGSWHHHCDGGEWPNEEGHSPLCDNFGYSCALEHSPQEACAADDLEADAEAVAKALAEGEVLAALEITSSRESYELDFEDSVLRLTAICESTGQTIRAHLPFDLRTAAALHTVRSTQQQ